MNEKLSTPSNITIERKLNHVEICLHGNVSFEGTTTGLERYAIEHQAVPEINYADINLSATLLGRTIGAPLMISSMTGGYHEAATLNRQFAQAAEHFRIPLGVGSMRQALENNEHRESFAVVRKAAPSVPVFANIGAPEVAAGLESSQIETMLDLIQADGLIVHLNAAQELFQPEGNTNFHGFLDQLASLTAKTPVPVIAKEVGSGISAEAARLLIDAGVKVIDVAGAGGTSWQKVEEVRYIKRFGNENRFSPEALNELLNWGIPTATCLEEIGRLKINHPQYQPIEIIASGGIQSGIDVAKTILLGASVAASAGRLLKALHEGKLLQTIEMWLNDLKAVMFLTGSLSLEQLQKKRMTLKHLPT